MFSRYWDLMGSNSSGTLWLVRVHLCLTHPCHDRKEKAHDFFISNDPPFSLSNDLALCKTISLAEVITIEELIGDPLCPMKILDKLLHEFYLFWQQEGSTFLFTVNSATSSKLSPLTKSLWTSHLRFCTLASGRENFKRIENLSTAIWICQVDHHSFTIL